MLLQLANFEFEKLFIQMIIVFICWLIVLVSVGIDFYFGVKKSKESGHKYVHSYGIRKSGKKLVQYMAVMAFMLFFDIINPLWAWVDIIMLPVFTIIGCAVWVWTERKSVLEKFDDKVKSDFETNAKDLVHTIKEISAEMKNLTSDVAEIRENAMRMKDNENTTETY